MGKSALLLPVILDDEPAQSPRLPLILINFLLMNPLPFPVGHKVICIDAKFRASVFDDFKAIPEEGKIYTIEELFWGNDLINGEASLGVRLTELPPIVPHYGGFCLWRFRLLEDEKTLRHRQRKAQLAKPAVRPVREISVMA